MEAGRRTLEAGHFVTVNPRPDTRAAASRVLGWSDDSIDRLERGDSVVMAERIAPAPASVAEAQIEVLRAEVHELRALVADIAAVLRGIAATSHVALPRSLVVASHAHL